MTDEALLRNRRVLVVEDEYMLADALQRNLQRAGAVVLGPVPSVDQALALIDREGAIDGAVLDIHLGEQRVYPVVDRLLAQGTPCIFTTGNDRADVPLGYAHLTRYEKPVDPSCVVRTLAGLAGPHGATGATGMRQAAFADMRDQLVQHIRTSSEWGQTLLAAKLCEALDALDAVVDARC
ncbi:hypothetical protein M9979_01480 [Sphingomonas sp. RP10(2022)]|uniref:Response regulatory domain-containing protein n=1 Tax=Sphingomonas liriopis TaxID=2949094 RepID=A0A9X2KP67_9SPHN|nr:hypothetical protein [Sphingomonas liriopis]MCP3733555.1 hypothetical protein [Sphingomonas liriopis]